ncbi:adenosylcobinamide-phosphate synthase CbiB [Anaerobium acetethylicum]|uniref:Cobalamin biosynthesis protein CobD n=1 Tax=Anaerobium acetethylicum TaxID=1619234 RepID=A0A1D3TQY5_9FIRM|nr:adenosylcobinamide-phosphate synthase CbiB [Anaerobium acetethylicum]SCP96042.1 adenosylcobinamide-phosphate synthase [Anaerobium acetethylicum]
MQYSLGALFTGFILDLIIGDPHWLWHPVRGIGAVISGTEKVLRRVFPETEKGELAAGFFLVAITVTVSTAVPAAVLFAAYGWNPWAGMALESILCYQLLATKSLKTESMRVCSALKKGGLGDGRKAVSMIVGRDTESLDEAGVIRAAVETVAENTSDGIIAPLLFMAAGGAAAGFFYKAVNTMDSMVGYKNDRYLYFGRAAAKLDDILNYVPARLSAWLMILASGMRGYNMHNALKIYRRDRFNHASPNSAHTEAVAAGALEVRLAGDAWYFGKLHSKKHIGDDIRNVERDDIRRANVLLYATAVLGLLFLGGVKLAVLMMI